MYHLQLGDEVLADVASKNFQFSVGNDVLLADNAYDRNKDDGSGPVKIVDPPIATPLVDIVLAVVFTLALIIVIVVVVIIIAACYK